MLSYRHAFHAGNHADVLKHYVFGLVLAYMNQKPKPYWVIDTHAGAGMYALVSFRKKMQSLKMALQDFLWRKTCLSHCIILLV